MSDNDGTDVPRCDVRIITRSVGGHDQAFMVRKVYINDREHLIPANSRLTIDVVPRGVSTLTLTLFPTSIEFEKEVPKQSTDPSDEP